MRPILPQFAREFVQHGRMRLGEGFVGAAGAVEEARQARLVQRTVQAHAAFACGDREQITLVAQGLQHAAHAIEKFGLLALDQIMKAIPLGKLRVIDGIERGRGDLQRVAQPEADHITCCFIGGNGQAQVAARRLNAARNVRRGIHQGAVPVEDNQIELLTGHLSGLPLSNFV